MHWQVLLLQDFAVSCLRKPKVHQFIQQLINDNKIILNALLLQLFEVLCEYLHIMHNRCKTCCVLEPYLIPIFDWVFNRKEKHLK